MSGNIESIGSQVHVAKLAPLDQLLVDLLFFLDLEIVRDEDRIHSVVKGLVFLGGLELVELRLVGV